MIPALKLLLRKQYPSTGRLNFDLVKINNGTGLTNPKVSLLVYRNGEPLLFIKTVRFPSQSNVVHRLHNVLLKISELHINGTPRLIWFETVQGVPVCAETFIKGTVLDPDNAKHMLLAGDWLAEFYKCSKKETISIPDLMAMYQKATDEIKLTDKNQGDSFVEYFSDSPLSNQDVRLPLISAHGDFTPSNVLLDVGGAINVIDWDGYGLINSPLFDLLTLLERFQVAESEKNKIIMHHIKLLQIPYEVVPVLEMGYKLMTAWRKQNSKLTFE